MFTTPSNNKTASATGGDHYKPKLKKTMKPRKTHDHRVNLGKLPLNHGANFTTNRVIGNNKGADMSTMQTMNAAKKQIGKHGVKLHSC